MQCFLWSEINKTTDNTQIFMLCVFVTCHTKLKWFISLNIFLKDDAPEAAENAALNTGTQLEQHLLMSSDTCY